MAKTIGAKRISVTALDKIMKETSTPPKTVEWNGLEVTIKHTIPFKDMLVFVDSVTKSCFESDAGAYLPEIRKFAIRCCVLEMYANFTLPSNVEHKYDLVYNTDAVDTVIKHVNTDQLKEILDAIEEKTAALAKANIESVNRQINDVYVAFDNLQRQISNVFSGINEEDINKFMGAVSDSKLDESKLIQAYIEQSKESAGE